MRKPKKIIPLNQYNMCHNIKTIKLFFLKHQETIFELRTFSSHADNFKKYIRLFKLDQLVFI